jgi:hypothetical protein
MKYLFIIFLSFSLALLIVREDEFTDAKTNMNVLPAGDFQNLLADTTAQLPYLGLRLDLSNIAIQDGFRKFTHE